MEVKLHELLAFVIDGGERLASDFGHFTFRKGSPPGWTLKFV
jgi:hypothetical protein